MSTREQDRLREARERNVPWRRWGPYLSERQWGTVREDYSREGIAWDHFPHDQARSRAYKWGEDGIAGFSDDRQRLCFALAFWNGKDPILKERLFGLNNQEGNHGEDVKEYYFYLDGTPTHSYMKMLYKYPQDAFPYNTLVAANKARTSREPEYELLDTGIFSNQRYFDIFVEYAKVAPEDVLIQIRIANRGPEAASLHVLPHLWFRNTWWMDPNAPRPSLWENPLSKKEVVFAQHPDLGERFLYYEYADEVLFTENETNSERIFNQPNSTPFVKDAFHSYLIDGRTKAVNPTGVGSKLALHYVFRLAPGAERVLRLRLCDVSPVRLPNPFVDFPAIVLQRQKEADAFYQTVTPPSADPEQERLIRQGFAGMLWSKQVYFYEVARWLKDHSVDPHGAPPGSARNLEWSHMINQDVISMPDKWEYPWLASWDLAFHAVAFAPIDPDFARDQLDLVLQQRTLHPNGQLPAYEQNFNEVQPPMQAWAAIFNYRYQAHTLEEKSQADLKRCFHKLLLNFTWWMNRKDRTGRDVIAGGLLGLDNIGVFDRSKPLPTGGTLEQADGNAWMALFTQNMLEIALELTGSDPGYEELAVKFYDHFVRIAAAMDRPGSLTDEMWDQEDGFFYDVLRLPDGSAKRLKVRSIVGLLPLCAVTVYSEEMLGRLPDYKARLREFAQRHPDLVSRAAIMSTTGMHNRRMLSILDEIKLRRVLAKVLDPNEFLSDFGVRSLSRCHERMPYLFRVYNDDYRVSYQPGESDSDLFGGNTNWRGPIWMPINVMLIRALLQLYTFYGDSFEVECPVGSGKTLTLFEVAQDLVQRLSRIFLRDRQGRRPVFGDVDMFQIDPHWRDHLLFYEYFNGDTGAGLGASHQTGWTGMIANLLCLFGRLRAEDLLAEGAPGAFRAMRSEVTLPA